MIMITITITIMMRKHPYNLPAPTTDFQLPTSRVHPCRSLLFVFTLIFILVSHRKGKKIKVKNMVKIKWNTTRIIILDSF